MLRTAQLFPHKGFRHWPSTRPAFQTKPPDGYGGSRKVSGHDSSDDALTNVDQPPTRSTFTLLYTERLTPTWESIAAQPTDVH